MADDALRIDKFLWFARLAKSRSLARFYAQQGHIRLDGRRIENGHARVRVGQIMSVPLPGGVRVRIESLPVRRASPGQVPGIYATLDDVADGNR